MRAFIFQVIALKQQRQLQDILTVKEMQFHAFCLLKPIANKRNNRNILPFCANHCVFFFLQKTLLCKLVHSTNSLLPSATCSVHRAKQTAVQHKHTLSFHRDVSDKNHPTIHEHKDTINKGSDSIYPLISSALYIFRVIKRLLHYEK